MSKTGKLMIVLWCLASILAIFIAPSVDSPDTVLPGAHHVLRGGSSSTVTLVAQTDKASSHSDWSIRSYQYILSAVQRQATVTRELNQVLRC
jgi:hypothetical protein